MMLMWTVNATVALHAMRNQTRLNHYTAVIDVQGLATYRGGGKGDMALEHPCKALLLIVGRRSQVNCPSHISCAILVLCSTVHQVELILCDPTSCLLSWSVVDNCPVWTNRAGEVVTVQSTMKRE